MTLNHTELIHSVLDAQTGPQKSPWVGVMVRSLHVDSNGEEFEVTPTKKKMIFVSWH